MPDVASGRMHAGVMCTCQVARTLTTLESRCTLWRVLGGMACCFLAKLVLGPPLYHDTFQTCQTWRVGVLVHHTTMTPFKRARRGEWAYECWRDVHVPHVAHTLTTHESRFTLWRVFGSMAFCVLAKLVLGPPHYHDTFQTCQTW